MNFNFDNRFVRELPADPETGPGVRQVHRACYSRVQPTPVRAPQLLAWSAEVAALLDLDEKEVLSAEFTAVFAGNKLLPGMDPYAACYGGHQFGNWAGQLGDGRAITLGEHVNRRGERWELQLKGAGPTPYSRRADGRAVLRSSIREFICSEAMHHLGVPTTRALSLVATGEQVVRDMFYDGRARPEPGAVVCRVAPSFIRFGNFELPAARGENKLLRQLIDFTIARDFPHLLDQAADPLQRQLDWFAEVCSSTAVLIAHWMRVGFVHGVMNTDNMSILGLTIDYGPYGWIDNFDLDWTPNTTDAAERRYRFGQQMAVAHWNLWQLANAVYPAIEDATALEAILHGFPRLYHQHNNEFRRQKLGFEQWRAGDDGDEVLFNELERILHLGKLDMSLFYRLLADFDHRATALEHFEAAFYDESAKDLVAPELQAWLRQYLGRVATEAVPAELRRQRMNAVNPLYVPRNYLTQLAIEQAEQGEPAAVSELLDVLRQPYLEQAGRQDHAARRPSWAEHKPGCSMLSCSS